MSVDVLLNEQRLFIDERIKIWQMFDSYRMHTGLHRCGRPQGQQMTWQTSTTHHEMQCLVHYVPWRGRRSVNVLIPTHIIVQLWGTAQKMRLVSLNAAGSLEIDQNQKVASHNFQKKSVQI